MMAAMKEKTYLIMYSRYDRNVTGQIEVKALRADSAVHKFRDRHPFGEYRVDRVFIDTDADWRGS